MQWNQIYSVLFVLAGIGLCANAYADNGYCLNCGDEPLVTTATPLPLPDERRRCCGSGFVAGIQGGYADTHWTNVTNAVNIIATQTKVESDGLTARIYAGYDFDHYLGIETGFVYLPESTIEGIAHFTNQNLSGKVSNFAYDILGKIMWPATDHFGFYVKAGGAYFRSGLSDSLRFLNIQGDNQTSVNHIGPAYGAGIFYHIVPNLTADVSWMHYSGNNKLFNDNGFINTDYQPNPDAVFLGISYKFCPMYIE